MEESQLSVYVGEPTIRYEIRFKLGVFLLDKGGHRTNQLCTVGRYIISNVSLLFFGSRVFQLVVQWATMTLHFRMVLQLIYGPQ